MKTTEFKHDLIESHKEGKPPLVFKIIITFGILFAGFLIVTLLYGILYLILSNI